MPPPLDENELGVPPTVDDPAPVVVRPIDDPTPILRTQAATGSLLVAGDGEGLVELAGAGRLTTDAPVRYAASLTDAASWDRALRDAGALVLTDTNRQRARRWGTVRENTGFTEPAGYEPLADDPTDARLDVFPTETSADRTVAQHRGVRAVRATAYGNPISYTPEDRPANALDGDLTSAWRVGAFADVVGERLRVDLVAPVQAGSVRLVQPLNGPRNRSITSARLHFDNGAAVDVVLGPESSTPEGQIVNFSPRTFRRLDFEIRATDAGRYPKYDGYSGVGLAELDVSGVRVDEVVRLPTSLLERAGARASAHPLVVLLSRQRANPGDPARGDEEPAMARTFSLPAPRRFDALTGTARLAATLPDDAIDELVAGGGPGAPRPAVVARSDARLPGDLRSRASAALDGDPGTAWQPGLLEQAGHWIEAEVPDAITVDHLDLQVVADGRHSVPTRVTVEVDGEETQAATLPPLTDRAERGAVAPATITFPALTGRRFRLTVEEVRSATTPDFFSPQQLELPVAIAELGLPGVTRAAAAGPFSSPCRDDLVTMDGRPFPVRVTGDVAGAVARQGLDVVACGVSAGLDLASGDHEVRTAKGRTAGIDIDRLVLSAAAVDPDPAGEVPAAPPRLDATPVGRSGFDVRVADPERPFWLVLGESHNLGWHLTIDGADAGPPTLVDGYANGWRIDAPGQSLALTLRWTPQRTVNRGIAISVAAVGLCLVILLASFVLGDRGRGGRRRRGPAHAMRPGDDEEALAATGAPDLDRPDRIRPPVLMPVAVAVAFGLAAGPVVGLVAAAVTALAVVLRPARWILAFGAATALAAAGAYTALQQARYRYPPDFAWPVNVERAHDLGWLAVALLVASVATRRHRREPARTEESLKTATASQQNRNEGATVPDAL